MSLRTDEGDVVFAHVNVFGSPGSGSPAPPLPAVNRAPELYQVPLGELSAALARGRLPPQLKRLEFALGRLLGELVQTFAALPGAQRFALYLVRGAGSGGGIVCEQLPEDWRVHRRLLQVPLPQPAAADVLAQQKRNVAEIFATCKGRMFVSMPVVTLVELCQLGVLAVPRSLIQLAQERRGWKPAAFPRRLAALVGKYQPAAAAAWGGWLGVWRIELQLAAFAKMLGRQSLYHSSSCADCGAHAAAASSAEGDSSSSGSLKACSACRLVWYCSPACQKRHWCAEHKEECPSMFLPASPVAAVPRPIFDEFVAAAGL